MDLNSILSLLNKGASSNETTIETNGLDLSNINPNVINQVRNEYLLDKEKIQNATHITPEILVLIGKMVQETNIIQILKDCKSRQDKKEKELFLHRESVKERYKKQKDNLMAKELIGIKISQIEFKELERELNNELYQLDIEILKDFDKEVNYLQREFVKLNVPLFKVTNNPKDIKLQQKVLNILQDMI